MFDSVCSYNPSKETPPSGPSVWKGCLGCNQIGSSNMDHHPLWKFVRKKRTIWLSLELELSPSVQTHVMSAYRAGRDLSAMLTQRGSSGMQCCSITGGCKRQPSSHSMPTGCAVETRSKQGLDLYCTANKAWHARLSVGGGKQLTKPL